MSDYETEEQQVEAIKGWWKDNGSSVILGVVLGVGAILSWNGWRSYQQSQAFAASDVYSEVTEAVDENALERVSSLADSLRSDHGKSAYAAMASLLEAKVLAQENTLNEAADKLQWVIDHSTLDELRVIASVRKARVLLAMGEPQGALDSLPDTEVSEFAGLVAEVKGDIHMALGDKEAARAAYLEAQQGRVSGNPSVLGMKIDDLAVEPPASTAQDENS